MNALAELTDKLAEAGFSVLTFSTFKWNADGCRLKTDDGYYGGICARDDGGLYFWSMTAPGSMRPRRGEARTPDGARAAVEYLILEHRASRNA